jgi:hypothetical protein
MNVQTDYTTPPPPPPVLPPPTSDSIVPLGLLNNDTNPPPSWVISTFGPGGTGVPPYLVVSVSSHKDGIHPGWLQNLIDNYSSGDSSGATPLSLPMWLLSIVEYQDYLESMADNGQDNSNYLQLKYEDWIVNGPGGGKLDDFMNGVPTGVAVNSTVCSKCDGNGNWVQNLFPYCPPGWMETLINPCTIKQPPIDNTGVDTGKETGTEIVDSYLPAVEEENKDIMKYAMIAGVVLVVYLLATRK